MGMILFRQKMVESTPEILADMKNDILIRSDDLMVAEVEIIEIKQNLQDAEAAVKSYEKQMLAIVTEEKKEERSNALARQGEALSRLEKDERWRALLQQCGELSNSLTEKTAKYDRSVRDYKIEKLYFEFALLGRRSQDA